MQIMNNEISGSVTSYNVTYSSSRNAMFDASIISAQSAQLMSCEEDVCNNVYTLNAPLTVCSLSATADLLINVSAINRVGQGLSSNTVTIGTICLHYDDSKLY